MAPSNLLRLATRRSVAPLSFRPALLAKRQFSQTALQSYPRVGSQDKDSIDTEATEYSKSGTDDGAARQEDAAFNPNKTGPEDEKNTAGDGNNVSHLLPNTYISQTTHVLLEQSIERLACKPRGIQTDRFPRRRCRELWKG